MKRVFAGSLLFAIGACKTTESSPLHSVPVKPMALIGTAYDAHTEDFTGMSCLNLSALRTDDYEMTPPGNFSSRVQLETHGPELEKVFGFYQKSFYAPATGLRLSRPYENVQRILANGSDAVKLVIVQTEPAVLRFRSEPLQKIRLTPEAQSLVQTILVSQGAEREAAIDAFVQLCGTGFLAGTRYTLGMAAMLRWTFKNPEERQRWQQEALDLDQDQDVEVKRPWTARLRYEVFLKETRDVNARLLGENGAKECTAEAYAPCLDAFRLFQNATVPAWQKLLRKLQRHADLILPQAFFSEPEIMSYEQIEPALAGIPLDSKSGDKEAWQNARARILDQYVQAFRRLQDSPSPELQARLQRISEAAAPCYRPRLDLAACTQLAIRLSRE